MRSPVRIRIPRPSMIKERIGVSTGTFIDFSDSIGDGKKIIGARLKNDIYAPEIDRALKVAKDLGIGLELVYRVGIENILFDGSERLKNRVLQIHGPVFVNTVDAIQQGIEEHRGGSLKGILLSAIQNPLIAQFANGTLEGDWQATKALKRFLRVQNIVLHPWGADVLSQKGFMSFRPGSATTIAIEPDFQRRKSAAHIIWETEKVKEIADRLGQGICLDTSHTVISYNSTDALVKAYEAYKTSPKGVAAIHFSVAVPSDNRDDFFTKGTGALPLYNDPAIIPPSVRDVYREFYQGIMHDASFTGPLILEMWSFPKGGSFEDRRKAVEETLNVLEGSNEPPHSISSPDSPTRR